jgi:hypothetical protein
MNGGIVSYVVLGINTGNPKARCYAVKSGEFKSRGIVLNFCPFCGKKIANPPTAGRGEVKICSWCGKVISKDAEGHGICDECFRREMAKYDKHVKERKKK